MTLTNVGVYNTISETVESPNSYLFDVQAPDGKTYLAKVPKNLDSGSSAERQFTITARNLKKIDSKYINKVVDSGRDADSGVYYMILEKIQDSKTLEQFVSENNEASKTNIKKIAQIWYYTCEGLERAGQKNIQHKDLHPKNILITKDSLPVIIDFGISILEHTISKKTSVSEYSARFAAPEYINKQENRLKARTDIYSLSLAMMYTMLGHQLFYEIENNDDRITRITGFYKELLSDRSLEILKSILEKSSTLNPNDRYMRHSILMDDILKFIDSIISEPEKPVFLRLLKENDENSLSFVKEINANGLCFNVNERLHSEHNSINAKLASSNFYVFSSFLSHGKKSLVVLDVKHKNNLEENELREHQWILKNKEPLKDLTFNAIDKNYTVSSDYYDVQALLERLHLEEKATAKRNLPRVPRQILRDYLTLLETEINHLKSKAFSIPYSSFTVVSDNEAEFKIKVDLTTIDEIKSLVHRSRQMFNKGDTITLYVKPNPKTEDKEQVGFSVDFNEKTGVLSVREFPENRKDELPIKGILYEDTSIMEIQYKRQLYAIKNYMAGKILNNNLRDYLFQPEKLNKLAEESGYIDIDLEVISKDKIGNLVNFQEAQKDAVLKSLYRKPLTIIQGPPGTGKTTVIAEIILQILKRDRQAKILITSQTNLAVDNVLSKMNGINGVSFIRLGKNIDDKAIALHSFDKKLSFWANKTKRKSDSYFSKLKKEFDKQNTNNSPVLNKILKEFNKKQDWSVAKRELKILLDSPFSKDYQELKPCLESRALFNDKLSDYLGDFSYKFNKLKLLHSKWKSILSNIENRDALKSRFITNINIVGATANHIAAGMYRDFNFEFDYVIMDEAAKATPSETLVPVNMAQQVIMVGDHLQLPPLVTATESVKQQVAEKLNLEDEKIDFDKIYYDKPSLFQIMFDGAPDEFKEMLDLQFRMPAQIGDIISKLVYDDKLRSSPLSGKAHKLNLQTTSTVFMCDTSKFPNRFHDKDPTSKSSYNKCNADVIIDILKTIDGYSDVINNEGYEVGVITGYGKQAEYLSNQIDDIKLHNLRLKQNLVVATVDSFQGAEKDIIIYDLVRSTRENDNSGLGFLEMPNRINVAFTRATRLLIVVGDATFLKNVRPSRRWTENNNGEPLLLQEFAIHLEKKGLIYNDPKEIFYASK